MKDNRVNSDRGTAPRNKPRPVLPLERQAKNDRTIGRVLAPILVALILSGVILLLVSTNSAGAHSKGLTVFAAVGAGLAVYVLLAAPIERFRPHDALPPAAPWNAMPPVAERVDDSQLLSYQPMRSMETEPPPANESLLVFVGFVYVICLIGAALFWRRLGLTTGWIAVWAIGIPLCTTILFRQTRGFAAGMAIAVVLMFIALPFGLLVLCAISLKRL